VSTCDYEYHNEAVFPIHFKCLELVHSSNATRCVFHDISYLEGDNYEKNKEEVANRFNRKLSKYSSNNIPFKFFGYCLPEISFIREEFTEAVYFNDATFYEGANFREAKLSKEASFRSAKFFGQMASFFSVEFFGKADFTGANFQKAVFGAKLSAEAYFDSVTFSEKTVTYFMLAKFSGNTNFTLTKFSGQATSFRQATFSGGVNFNLAMFSGQANLSKANFKGITYFSGTTFQKEADFNQAAFFDRAYFSDRHVQWGNKIQLRTI
jgi:uncharacterized protein YjbI with pentapeptide repeats